MDLKGPGNHHSTNIPLIYIVLNQVILTNIRLLHALYTFDLVDTGRDQPELRNQFLDLTTKHVDKHGTKQHFVRFTMKDIF